MKKVHRKKKLILGQLRYKKNYYLGLLETPAASATEMSSPATWPSSSSSLSSVSVSFNYKACIKTETITDASIATVHVWFLLKIYICQGNQKCTVAFAPSATDSGFQRKFRFCRVSVYWVFITNNIQSFPRFQQQKTSQLEFNQLHIWQVFIWT